MLNNVVRILIMLILVGGQSVYNIDLTSVVTKNRLREPTVVTTSMGLVGGNGAVSSQSNLFELTLLSVKYLPTPEPNLLFEIQVQNISEDTQLFPVDHDLADFEPHQAGQPYTYDSALLSLSSEGRDRKQLFFPGVSLHGSKDVTGSFRQLRKGESIRIRALTPFTPIAPATRAMIPIQASVRVRLYSTHSRVSYENGVLHQESEEAPQATTLSNSVLVNLNP